MIQPRAIWPIGDVRILYEELILNQYFSRLYYLHARDNNGGTAQQYLYAVGGFMHRAMQLRRLRRAQRRLYLLAKVPVRQARDKACDHSYNCPVTSVYVPLPDLFIYLLY
jgi:hypothetical protein